MIELTPEQAEAAALVRAFARDSLAAERACMSEPSDDAYRELEQRAASHLHVTPAARRGENRPRIAYAFEMRSTALPLLALLLAIGCGEPDSLPDGGSGDAATCELDHAVCAGECVDLGSDRRHCGACGIACGAGEVCDGGACAACDPADTACGGVCVSLESDPAHCGGCDVACAPNERCDDGACRVACASDRAHCATECVDLGSDPDHCGSCDAACAEGAICEAGACAAACEEGRTLCADACVDLAGDPGHCGACGNACASGDVCRGGECQRADDCRAVPCVGLTWCDTATGRCEPGCDSDSQCAATEICDRTSHACRCPAGSHACSGRCVSDDDPATCGSSCAACPGVANATTTCDGMSCGWACDPGFHACGDACVSDDSVESCGTSCSPCPTAAGMTATCDGVSCGLECAAGTHLCGGACVADDDATACGASCTPCTAPTYGDATCEAGACGFTCWTGWYARGSGCRRWDETRVEDSIDSLSSLSIAVAPDSRAFIAYSDGGGRIAYGTAAGFSSFYVGGGIGTGRANDIGFDAAGRPHAVFSSAGAGVGLHYVVLNPPGVSGWRTELIEACPTCPQGWSPALAFDSADRPHALFYADGAVRHAVRDAGTWIGEDVATPGPSGSLDVAVDASDAVHAGFRVGSAGPVAYHLKSASTWMSQPAPGVGDLVAFFVEPGRVRWVTPGPDPEIVTVAGGATTRVAIRQPGEPSIERIAAAEDSAGNLHFAVVTPVGGRHLLSWRRLVGGEWHTDGILNSSSSFGAVAIAMDSRDRPHVAMRLGVIVLGYAYAP